ncbi:MAG: hypothetical protein GY704_04175, partial [Phycisphaeraceae bacterium]|nr:hypothetical protein [Phycisphaeraceae bacterium]
MAEPTRPTRYLGIGGAPSTEESAALDLSTGTPDPALLPALHEAVERFTSGATAWTSSYLDEPVLPALREHLEQSWPFRAQRMTVVDGALDGLSRIVDQLVGLGDRVIMESPGFPPLIDRSLDRLHTLSWRGIPDLRQRPKGRWIHHIEMRGGREPIATDQHAGGGAPRQAGSHHGPFPHSGGAGDRP